MDELYALGSLDFSSEEEDADEAVDETSSGPRVLATPTTRAALSDTRLPPCMNSAPPMLLRSPVDPAYFVERVHFSKLSVAAFRRRAAVERNPIIFTGLAEHAASRQSLGLSIDFLEHYLDEDLEVPVRGRGSMPVSDFFSRLRAGEHVYLADVPIARSAHRHCFVPLLPPTMP